MSATAASPTLSAAALTAEKGVAVASKPRKRTAPTTASGSEAALDVPPLSAANTRATRRLRDPAAKVSNAAGGEASGELGFSRDLNVLDGEMPVESSRGTETVKRKVSVAGGGGDTAAAAPAVKLTTGKHLVHRTGAVRKERQTSIWDTVGHFFSRFFLIFIVAVGLGTTFWNYRGSPSAPAPPATQDKIALELKKLDEFVTKTTKYIQVQLEMIDMKIGKQVGELRDEVQQNIDLQVVNLGTELKSIQTQLDRLRGDDDSALSRTEALEMMRSVAADMLAVEGEGESLSLEDVRAVARQIVLTELQKHMADGIGRPDYALASGGGVVVDHSEGFFVGRGGKWSMAALSLLPGVSQKHPLANKLLEPSFGEPGQCLPLKGSNVFVEVSLRTSIIPTAITLEHVSKSAAYDVKSSPKEFRIFGWRELRKSADHSIAQPTVQRLLGEFSYDVEGSSVQTFELAKEDVGEELINMVRLHVLTNHGNPLHTCLYRLRVHGEDLQSSAVH